MERRSEHPHKQGAEILTAQLYSHALPATTTNWPSFRCQMSTVVLYCTTVVSPPLAQLAAPPFLRFMQPSFSVMCRNIPKISMCSVYSAPSLFMRLIYRHHSRPSHTWHSFASTPPIRVSNGSDSHQQSFSDFTS